MRFLLALLFVSSCGIGCELPAAEVPTEQVFSDCEQACSNLQRLGCEEGEADEDGTTCVVVCEETMAAGLIDLDLEIVKALESCPE